MSKRGLENLGILSNLYLDCIEETGEVYHKLCNLNSLVLLFFKLDMHMANKNRGFNGFCCANKSHPRYIFDVPRFNLFSN